MFKTKLTVMLAVVVGCGIPPPAEPDAERYDLREASSPSSSTPHDAAAPVAERSKVECNPDTLLDAAKPYFEELAPESEPELTMIEDLNGDGRLDFVVGLPMAATASGSFIYATTEDESCYTEVYFGEGGVSTEAEVRNGWKTLSIAITPMFASGRGFATARAEYNGSKYVVTSVTDCSTLSDPQPTEHECQDVLGEYGSPDAAQADNEVSSMGSLMVGSAEVILLAEKCKEGIRRTALSVKGSQETFDLDWPLGCETLKRGPPAWEAETEITSGGYAGSGAAVWTLLSLQPVRLSPMHSGLLVHYAHGYKHVRHRYQVLLLAAGGLRPLLREHQVLGIPEGAGLTSNPRVSAYVRDSGDNDELIVEDIKASVSDDEFADEYATRRFRWTGSKLVPSAATPEVVFFKSYPDLKAARQAQAKAENTCTLGQTLVIESGVKFDLVAPVRSKEDSVKLLQAGKDCGFRGAVVRR